MREERRSAIVLSRRFEVPRELVFLGYSEARHLAAWWGPRGLSVACCELDFRVGGSFRYCLRLPDGHEMWAKLTYREITRPGRIVYTDAFADENGATIRAPFSVDWPLEVQNSLSLTEQGGVTMLEMRVSPLDATTAERRSFEAARTAVAHCINGSLDALSRHLAARLALGLTAG